MNLVILIGNLGRDPECEKTQGGDRWARLSIATSISWKDKNTGERKEKVEWHRVVVWGDGLVDVIDKYAKKGGKVHVVGKLQTRKWQDQQGKDCYSTEVVVSGFGSSFRLLGSPNSGGERNPPMDDPDAYSRPGSGGQTLPADYEKEKGFDEEIPF